MTTVTKQIEKEIKRNKLSEFLPYLAFDQSTGEFLNSDSSYGYLFECTPCYFVDKTATDTLSSIIKQDYGVGAILQLMLFADTDISAHCEQIIQGDIKQTPLTQKMSKHHTQFLQDPSAYAEKIKDNNLKDYRLFVAL